MNDSIETREVKVENIEQDLLIKLTSEEMVTRAKRMSHLMQRMSEMDAARDSANKLAKGEIAKLAAERDSLANEITIGQRLAKVKCQEVFDYRLGSVRIIRLDTKEVVDERPMSARERQPELPLANRGGDSDEAAAAAAGFFAKDDSPSDRLRIIPPHPAKDHVAIESDDTEEDPDLSVLDATPTHAEPRDTEVPPPELKTEKRPKKPRKGKDGGK
jgi:hypothetical protein